MKTLINIVDQDIFKLDRFSQQKGVSRSHLIREAIAQFIVREEQPIEDVFGLLKQDKYQLIDGLDYQNKLRDEW